MSQGVRYTLEAIPTYTNLPNFIKNLNFGMFKKTRTYVNDFQKLIHQIIDKRKHTNDSSKDILSLLMNATATEDEETGENLKPLTETDLVSNIFVLLVAGHETTYVIYL